ncbi:MAG: hypothetical protein J7577_22650 [Sphingobacteriaceae bacterium]|nr:hypothetical protein [Sphingobacteriaceae bacterium]
MKTTTIFLIPLVLLFFSCGAKHENERQPSAYLTDSASIGNEQKTASAESDSLKKLAANMVASRETYIKDGSTAAEDLFIKALIEQLKKPGAFEKDFAGLREYEINILKADDQKLRLFYWLSPYSGSMWHVQNIVQYKDENNIIRAVSFNSLYKDKDDEGSPTPFFDHIYALDSLPQKTYLFTGYGQMSGTEPYSVSHILMVKGSGFSINQPLFKVGKEGHNQLFATAELKEDQDKEKLLAQLAMTYNPKDKTISYPEVTESKNGAFFNGKRNILTFRDGVFK